MEFEAGRRIGLYEIGSLLGRGGMGEVYSAVDTRLGRKVALKRLRFTRSIDDPVYKRFLREARAASALNHPNIITVYGLEDWDGWPVLVTELVEGSTLRDRIRAGINLTDAVEVAVQVSSALSAAASAGVVHRDIKPDNIMIRPDGLVKVLDFGLAKMQPLKEDSSQQNEPALTEHNQVVGTLRYMSPEQLKGLELDARSDCWSLGTVLYEMVTGTSAFRRPSHAETVSAILTQAPAPPSAAIPGLLPALEKVILRSLEKEPARRYTPAEMLEALLAIREELPVKRSVTARSSSGGWLRSTSAPVTASSSPSGESETEILDKASTGAASSPIFLLPQERTSFVGRESELAALRTLLRKNEARLVTLTGPGGTGKTRLATEAARQLAREFRDGTAVIPLANVTNPAKLGSFIAFSLNLREAGGASLDDALFSYLRSRDFLLVLDNFEQLAEGGSSLLDDLLEASSRLKILVTSRVLLRLSIETEFPVLPLPVPQDAAETATEALAESPAIRLFVARAKAASSTFELTEANILSIAGICQRLQGLPLAIELAASRVRILPPAMLLSRLSSQLKLLTGGARDLPQRQQTMRGAIDWGYDLLSPEEQELFAILGVFAGGFSLEAASEVTGEPLTGFDVLDGIASLAEKSFLRRDEMPQGVRFSMLEVLREYALEKLQESGLGEGIRARHARHFLEFALLLSNAAAEMSEGAVLEALDREHENIRVALSWARDNKKADFLLELSGALRWCWYLRGLYQEGRQWIETGLSLSQELPAEVRMKGRLGAGHFAFLQCDYKEAEKHLEEARELAEALGDRDSFATAVQFLGSVAREQGQYSLSLTRHEQARKLYEEDGDIRGRTRSLNYISMASWLHEDFEGAEAAAEEAIEAFETVDDKEGIVWAHLNRTAIAFHQNNLEEAQRKGRDALNLAAAAGFQEGIAWALDLLGRTALAQGSTQRAGAFLQRSLNLHFRLGDRWRTSTVLEAIARLRLERGDPERATTLLAAADKIRAIVSTPVPKAEEATLLEAVGRCRSLLTASKFENAWRAGSAFTLERAVKFAIGVAG
jgi:non-specific serine/threonine protein kinase